MLTGLVSVPISAAFFWVYHHFVNPKWVDYLVQYERSRLIGNSTHELEGRIAAIRAHSADKRAVASGSSAR